MTCSEFLDGYSDYRDGLLDPLQVGKVLRHLESCSSCRRYDRVVAGGTRVLRNAPEILPREDMKARVRRAIAREDVPTRAGVARPAMHAAGVARAGVEGAGVNSAGGARVVAARGVAIVAEPTPGLGQGVMMGFGVAAAVAAVMAMTLMAESRPTGELAPMASAAPVSAPAPVASAAPLPAPEAVTSAAPLSSAVPVISASPLVAAAPVSDPAWQTLPSPSIAPRPVLRRGTFEDVDFLAGSNVLLHEGTSLYRRHREPEIFRAELR